ncbi:MAG: TolB family protein, partial [Gemmatirosa sp.]
ASSTLDARRSTLRRLARTVLAGALLLAAHDASAQGVDPRGDWRTLATPHFRVHFRAEHETQGRRAAADAERAWARLAAELTAPRRPVDLVVADNVDFSNGYATTFPTNRIVVYAQPPVDVASLRFYDDWSELLITHELTHVFHLDRSRGVWRALQGVFGRHPALFPNAYAPSWLTEGLAVYFESRITGAGRVLGSEHRLIARTAAADGRLPRLDQLSLESSVYPGGQQAYVHGSLVFDYLARHGPADGARRFVERSSAMLIPYRLNRAARGGFGLSFHEGWRRWRDSIEAQVRTDAEMLRPATGDSTWRPLTREGWYAAYPRWRDGATIVYGANDARDVAAAYAVTLDGARTRLGRRNSLSPNVPLTAGPFAGGTLFAQLEYADPFTVRGDLWVQTARAADFGAASRGQRRLTHGARLAHPDARTHDGAIVAVQTVAGTTRLVRVSPDGARITPLTQAAADTQWAEPRWSPDGASIAAVRLGRGGRSAVVVLDTSGASRRVIGEERAVLAAPAWAPDGRTLVWSSDRSGTPQLYAASLDDPRVRRLDVSALGVTQPAPAPDGSRVAGLLLRADGLHVAVRDAEIVRDTVHVAPLPAPAFAQTTTLGDVVAAPGAARAYSAWRSLLPRYWTPLAAQADRGSTLLGAATSGRDVLGRHAYDAQLSVNVDTRDVEGGAAYRLTRWARPYVDVSATQAWQYDLVAVRRGGAVETRPLDRRTRELATSLVFARPRYRTSSSLSIGAFWEGRAYRSTVPALVTLADTTIGRAFPGIGMGGAWSNVRRPLRSISPEDGVALSFSAQQRWPDGSGAIGGASRRAIGVARAYRSLDLPGF